MEGKSRSSGKKRHRTGRSFGVLVLANEFGSGCVCVCSIPAHPVNRFGSPRAHGLS